MRADRSRAVVAWVIGRPWQGRGIASRGADLMLGLLRDRGVTTIEAYVAPGHAPSERVATRAGLVATAEPDADGQQRWVPTAG